MEIQNNVPLLTAEEIKKYINDIQIKFGDPYFSIVLESKEEKELRLKKTKHNDDFADKMDKLLE